MGQRRKQVGRRQKRLGCRENESGESENDSGRAKNNFENSKTISLDPKKFSPNLLARFPRNDPNSHLLRSQIPRI